MFHSTVDLKAEILRLGFQSVGVSKAVALDKEAHQLEQWLNKNYHGDMSYMEHYFDLRIDPTRLMPGCKSVIVLTLNYYQDQQHSDNAKISRYAYGSDYHKVLKNKAKKLHQWMMSKYGDIQFRAFVDSAPIMERVWAEKSGVSWSGKNTLSITPQIGSYFFLMCILTDLEFEYSAPIKDFCGTCKRCIEACPTNAIHQDGYLLDASKCISYLTIELRKNIADEFSDKMDNWLFGCDICQEVCPWNSFAKKTEEEEFNTRDFIKRDLDYWLELEEESWNTISQKSAIKRTGFEGIKKNARFLKNQMSKQKP
ncbi:MAG: tRNA epoxyqueuosine(34) reductase QueG [Saprospiraceae bacterium]|nr:tRNA epoxyqueuosine(34) reductase QueG [Saprospiraceae bacterium]